MKVVVITVAQIRYVSAFSFSPFSFSAIISAKWFLGLTGFLWIDGGFYSICSFYVDRTIRRRNGETIISILPEISINSPPKPHHHKCSLWLSEVEADKWSLLATEMLRADLEPLQESEESDSNIIVPGSKFMSKIFAWKDLKGFSVNDEPTSAVPEKFVAAKYSSVKVLPEYPSILHCPTKVLF
ncbi:hypothetical protein L2E82_21431 [Cichorium intybus]|uniref:Uncharacterized protein n=1 Tax=Cichorium intybus TaxID=13427 RepID=A0ACB9DVI6_CICIN|nr:hypothetical protein L2E82_21431 [Cichorium intybus]